ncbi:hypothetical protein M5225_000324 [Vibrio vulnificus]|nr:hypothetical protein [Vibrio cholerae]EHU4850599.1 hypothetical protein [Vibrio vulnificus]NAW91519.1 hypothetical protein [Vibrio sp. V24_P1S3T111]TXY29633.1 hypothetical protein FXE86_13990 [Vibrio mimicus]EGQ9730948.1 hypothetical protein [Vibrio cholerae]
MALEVCLCDAFA